MENCNLEEEEHVKIDERDPEFIDEEIMAVIDELENRKTDGGDGTPT